MEMDSWLCYKSVGEAGPLRCPTLIAVYPSSWGASLTPDKSRGLGYIDMDWETNNHHQNMTRAPHRITVNSDTFHSFLLQLHLARSIVQTHKLHDSNTLLQTSYKYICVLNIRSKFRSGGCDSVEGHMWQYSAVLYCTTNVPEVSLNCFTEFNKFIDKQISNKNDSIGWLLEWQVNILSLN